jgi:hypothetical protein
MSGPAQEQAAAMPPWIETRNRMRSALGATSPLRWIAALDLKTTTAPDTSDTEPHFVPAGAVKPREATAVGGPGLTALAPTQSKSGAGGDNLLGNDS